MSQEQTPHDFTNDEPAFLMGPGQSNSILDAMHDSIRGEVASTAFQLAEAQEALSREMAEAGTFDRLAQVMTDKGMLAPLTGSRIVAYHNLPKAQSIDGSLQSPEVFGLAVYEPDEEGGETRTKVPMAEAFGGIVMETEGFTPQDVELVGSYVRDLRAREASGELKHLYDDLSATSYAASDILNGS